MLSLKTEISFGKNKRRHILKRFLLWILVVILAVIVLSIPYILGYISATDEISSIVRIIFGTITLCIADIKAYLQQKVINWDKKRSK